MKRDLTEVHRVISTFSRNANIVPSALWYIMNETAILAMKNDVKWMVYLSQNSLIGELCYRGAIPIDEWLVNSGIGFSEEKYKEEQDKRKDRDITARMNRQQINSLKTLAASVKGRSKQSQNENKSSKNKKLTFKAILRDVSTVLTTFCPNQLWDKTFCVFWNHPSETCRYGDKCRRKHSCPVCGGSHPIHNCDGPK